MTDVRGKNMNAYVYQNKTLHISRYRRQGDGTPHELRSQTTGYDRRREKIRQGIMLMDYERRQISDPHYSGLERRSGIERRSGVDRRQSV
jgi:hypothetical protein